MRIPQLYLCAALAAMCVYLGTAPRAAAQSPPTPQPAAEADDGGWRELEPTIVTATPIPQRQSTLGTATTVVTAADAEAQGIVDVRDALELSPGVVIGQTGSRGSLGSLFLRGGNSDFTLVLIDGIPVSDVGGFYDFGPLTMDNVEQVEILRGAQSALHGADAMSGVVNIITKRGEGPATWRYDLSAGTRDSARTTVSVSGGTERSHYSASLGQSMTGNRAGIGSDGFDQYTASARAGVWLGDDVEIDGTFRFDRFRVENPGPFTIGIPVDIDDETEERRVVAGLTITHHISDTWEHRLKLGRYDRELKSRDGSVQDPFSDFLNDTVIRVERYVVDYRHSVTVLDDHILTVGGELEEEEGSFVVRPPGFPFTVEKRVLNRAGYAQVQSSLFDDTLHLQAGVRVDNNSGFGSETSPRVAGSYRVKQTHTRAHASYGEGIKNPDIFDLASPFGANPNLDPERSAHWDVGIEQELFNGRAIVDVTYFEQEIDDLIITPAFGVPPVNLDRTETSGIEVTAKAQIRKDLIGTATYTFLETNDKQTHDDLIRRPKHTAHASLTYRPGPWHAGITARFVGESPDLNFNVFPAVRVVNDDYVRVNVHGGYAVNDRVEVYVRVENVLDDHYQSAFGFESNGATGIVGVRGTL